MFTVWALVGGRAARLRRPRVHPKLARVRLLPDRGPSEAISQDSENTHMPIIAWSQHKLLVFASGRTGFDIF